ncbi:MAG: signal peptidase II [Oligoflexia bacterium]|nr:signal peptidase II [Oligoflexia bacterium]
MKIKYLLLASIGGVIISLDQLTKTYIHTRFTLGESYTIIPNFFDITYIRNPGAAFGILATAPTAFRETFFAIIPILAVVLIIGLIRQTAEDQKLSIISLSLVFGGAIGNYIDRLRFKYVIDFLYFHYKDVFYYPAFNVADSAIVVGIVILITQMLLQKKAGN